MTPPSNLTDSNLSQGRGEGRAKLTGEITMKNKMIDLNNHLFAQLERLSDEELTPEQIEIEVKRDGVTA